MNISNQLKQLIFDVVRQLYSDCKLSAADISIQHPKEMSHGDYATTVALSLGKILGKSPIEIAQKITDALQEHISAGEAGEVDQSTDQRDQKESGKRLASSAKRLEKSRYKISYIISKVQMVPPGFINLWLNPTFLITRMQEVPRTGLTYGDNQKVTFQSLKKSPKQRIMVEFAHPNTHKEFHIGHLRNITTGESLCRLFEAVGHEVIRVNYQGDVGMHIAKALYGILKDANIKISDNDSNPNFKIEIEKFLNDFEKQDIYERVTFLGKTYALGSTEYEKGGDIKEEIHRINKEIYRAVNNEAGADGTIKLLWHTTRKWSLEYFDSLYKRLGTTFKRLYFEGEVNERGLEVSQEALKDGILTKHEGAVIFDGKPFGLDTRVFINSLGLPTYEGKEMGLAELEFTEFGTLDKLIHVLGPEQKSFTAVTFKVEELLGIQKDQQLHLAYGWVRLKHGKMSSRLGNVVTGRWLLDNAKERIAEILASSKHGSDVDVESIAEAAAVAAVKYSFLRVGVTSEIVFDLEESISFEGNSGPYLQYTYARTCSVLRKSQMQNAKLQMLNEKENLALDIGHLSLNNEELVVLRLLYRFPEVVVEAAATYSPNMVCSYLYDLAGAFNGFYNKHTILGATQNEISNDKLQMTNQFQNPKSKSEVTQNFVGSTHFRLLLTQAVGITIKNGLYLLGIPAPERM